MRQTVVPGRVRPRWKAGIAAAVAFALAAPLLAEDPGAPFARSKLISHLPASTVTMVLVDLERIRASDASGEMAWASVALGQISERFRFEEHQIDLERDAAAFAFVEIWDGTRYGSGYLFERRKGGGRIAPGPGVRELE